jgi:hypothetical protein
VLYEIEPLAGEHEGKWAVRIIPAPSTVRESKEQPFFTERVFGSEQDARRHGEAGVASLGGTAAKGP